MASRPPFSTVRYLPATNSTLALVNVQPGQAGDYSAVVFNQAGSVVSSAARLTVNRETRPYEWAWCLYAGAIAGGQTRERHVV